MFRYLTYPMILVILILLTLLLHGCTAARVTDGRFVVPCLDIKVQVCPVKTSPQDP